MSKKVNFFFVLFLVSFLFQFVNASETIEPEILEAKYSYNILENIDVVYSVNNSWFNARKIESPNSFIINYKQQNKTIGVNLAEFDLDKTVYALVLNNQSEINQTLRQILEIEDFNNSNFPLQTNFKINNSFNIENLSKISFRLDNRKLFVFNIEKDTVIENLVLIFIQKNDDKLNIMYTNLYILDHSAQSAYQLCEINRRIVSFYCKGYNCQIPNNCLDCWDFDESKFIIEKPKPIPEPELQKPIPEPESNKQPEQPNFNATISQQIVNRTIFYLGTKYNWAGRNSYYVRGAGTLNSGLDCVGLKYVVLRDLGYLDDSASCLAMFSDGCAFADFVENNKGHITGTVGVIKNKSELDLLKPGDLLSLNTKSAGLFGHAGVYISTENGIHKYIHASGTKSNPDKVKYDTFEDKLKSGALKFPFHYVRISNVNKNNIDCSKNYVTVTNWKGRCCPQTKYC